MIRLVNGLRRNEDAMAGTAGIKKMPAFV